LELNKKENVEDWIVLKKLIGRKESDQSYLALERNFGRILAAYYL